MQSRLLLFSQLERDEYFGSKIFGFAIFSNLHFQHQSSSSVGETLHVAYKKYKIKKILFFGKYQIYFIS